MSVRLHLPDDPNVDMVKRIGVECIPGDISRYDDVLRATEGVDAVFHLAALILFYPKDRPILWNVNILGTYNVFEAAVRSGKRPLRLIFASSDQVYPGPAAKYRPADETHPLLPNTFYGLSKLLGEEMMRFYGRTEKDVNISIARFTHTEAPEELIDPNGFFAHRLFFVNGRLRYLKGMNRAIPKSSKRSRCSNPSPRRMSRCCCRGIGMAIRSFKNWLTCATSCRACS